MNLEQVYQLHADQFDKMGLPVPLRFKVLEKIITSVYDCSSAMTVGLVKRRENSDEETNEEERLIEYEISASEDLEPGLDVYLIDNWFTFPLKRLSKFLEKDVELLDRVEQLIGLSPLGGQPEETNGHVADIERKNLTDRIESVYDHMWKFVGNYTMKSEGAGTDDTIESDEEKYEPVWYFMDHYGTHITRSISDEEVNVKISPFIFTPTMASYSVLWVVKDVEEGEPLVQEHTYALKSRDQQLKDVQMIPWEGVPDFQDPPPLHEPKWDEVCKERSQVLPSDNASTSISPLFFPQDRTVTVFTSYADIRENLSSPHFRFLVASEESEAGHEEGYEAGDCPPPLENSAWSDDGLNSPADVLFLLKHFKDFDRLPNMQKIVNQFPGEHVMMCKDLLAACARSLNDDGSSTFPPWCQQTYNLRYELPRFVYDWKTRTESLDSHGMNLWIVKPWNLSRGMATYVTNNLDQIVRMCEADIPLIAQKYIERPLLYPRDDKGYCVKFDMRVFVCVQSIEPLKAYAYNNLWQRIANLEFKLEHFHEYERHFSCMGYAGRDAEVTRLGYDEFKQQMFTFYSGLNWNQVVSDSHRALREMFQLCSSKGLCQLPNSRAIYGVDFMVKYTDDNKLQPVILEVNFVADTEYFIKYNPDFYNAAFELLFLDKWTTEQFTPL
ncbi:tubulin--tyrosine ligase-like protein 12 isoform X2 [Convolutriloba macropyga]